MVYCDRIDVSEAIHVNKMNASMECIICQYWHFFDKGFRFILSVCNGCCDILMMSFCVNNITIISIYGVDYRGIIF